MTSTSLGSVLAAALALAGCAAPLHPPAPGVPALAAPVDAPSVGLPAVLDQDLPGQDCQSDNGTRQQDQAGDEVVRWAGCIGANVPVFRDPSLGTGPDADLWVPWHTRGIVVIVHVHGEEPLNVTLTFPDTTKWSARDAGAAGRDSIVRFEQAAPAEGTWHLHGDVESLTALRAWTITAVLQPA